LRIENHHQRGAGMLPQGVLGFQYEADRSSGGLTGPSHGWGYVPATV
jgi:hypothetical protein